MWASEFVSWKRYHLFTTTFWGAILLSHFLNIPSDCTSMWKLGVEFVFQLPQNAARHPYSCRLVTVEISLMAASALPFLLCISRSYLMLCSTTILLIYLILLLQEKSSSNQSSTQNTLQTKIKGCRDEASGCMFDMGYCLWRACPPMQDWRQCTAVTKQCKAFTSTRILHIHSLYHSF